MTVRHPARAALSAALAIAAPMLSSACAHDPRNGPNGAYDQRQSGRARPGGVSSPSEYGARRPSAILRRDGPTYVEAIFERRKSGVGPPFRERFHGFAQATPDGRSTIAIRNIAGTVRCAGRSRVTRPPSGPGAIGLRGEAFISCDDGRYAIADYRYVTNTRGDGVGRDNLGNRFTIRFMVVP
jgi:hypothetical protein